MTLHKVLLSIFCLIILNGVTFGQITLKQSNHIPSVGESYTYITERPAPFKVSKTGANKTWDLSSVNGQSITYFIVDPDSTADGGKYPNADYASVDTVQNTESFYTSSGADLSLVGQFIPNQVRSGYKNDLREILKFPISYNDSHQETFSGTTENLLVGQTYNRSGDSKIKAAGYGTLILPYGTVNNVLMVRRVLNYSDESGGNTVANYKDTIIRWYNASTTRFIASYVVNYSDGNQQTEGLTYLKQDDLITSVPENSRSFSNLSLYPNPAKHHVKLTNLPQSTTIDIYNIEGKKVRESEHISQKSKKLNVSEYSPGIYFINIQTEKGRQTKRFIKR